MPELCLRIYDPHPISQTLKRSTWNILKFDLQACSLNKEMSIDRKETSVIWRFPINMHFLFVDLIEVLWEKHGVRYFILSRRCQCNIYLQKLWTSFQIDVHEGEGWCRHGCMCGGPEAPLGCFSMCVLDLACFLVYLFYVIFHCSRPFPILKNRSTQRR